MNDIILSDLVITGIRSASTIYNPENAKARRIDRVRWAVAIKYEGATVYETESRKYRSDARHPIILPRGCSYTWQCIESGHCAIIEFDSELVCEEPFTFSFKSIDKLMNVFKTIEQRLSTDSPTARLESIRDLYDIVLMLTGSSHEGYVPGRNKERVEAAIAYIVQNYDKRITNEQLANIAGVSTVYFRKMFYEQVGISPISYVKRIRIEKAKDMLMSDYGSLTYLAQSLGYTSLYDFSRDFKKHTGLSPSKYLKER